MSAILVENLMTANPVCVTEGTSLKKAVSIMAENRFGSVIVVNKGQGFLRGIITEEMVVLALDEKGEEGLETAIVDDHMLEYPQTVSEKDSIEDVLRLMKRQRLDHVVVIDNMRPIGVISRSDIVRYLGSPGDT